MSILNKLTLAQLKENKKRTFLTGLSITMIVALLMAIAMFLSSIWVFTHDSIVKRSGDWHFKTGLVTKQQVDDLKTANFIDTVFPMPNGVATVSGDAIKSVQLPTMAVDDLKQFKNTLGYLNTGYWPENDDHIVLPYSIVDGNRDIVGQKVSLTANNMTKTYTVTGLYHVSDQSVAYFITKKNDFPTQNYTIFAKSNTLNQNYFKTVKDYAKTAGFSIKEHNTTLLALYLITSHEQFDSLIKHVLPTIIILISIISIAVISSSFSLSLNERLKQLGALSSIGTTRGQLVKMMFLESAWIGTVSIILGLIIGYIGMSISLSFIDNYAQQLFYSADTSHFRVVIYWPSIVFVVVVSALLIALSSIIPSIRASRRTPIDNIKQVPFSKVFKFKRKGKNVKRPLSVKWFGQPAFLAKRYQKHYASRSRLIFFVLTISLITFNVVSSLMLILTTQLNQVANNGYIHNIHSNSGVVITQIGNSSNQTDVEDYIKTLDGVEKLYTIKTRWVLATQSDVLNIVKRGPHATATQSDGTVDYLIQVATLQQKEEVELLKQAKVSKEEFETKGILVSDDFNTGKEIIPAVSQGQLKNISLLTKNSEKGYKNVFIATSIPANKLSFSLTNYIVVFVSQNTFDSLDDYSKSKVSSRGEIAKFISVNIASNKRDNMIKDIKKFAEQKSPNIYINDVQGQRKQIYAFLGIVQILVYGFLSLIAIICLTTFYNTISANVDLRQREVAMLQSVGMTRKQLRTMLSIEHLKIGIYTVISATILSFTILHFVIYSISSSGNRAVLPMPLTPTLISSVVFLAILILFNVLTMRQALKYSIVEKIKDETL